MTDGPGWAAQRIRWLTVAVMASFSAGVCPAQIPLPVHVVPVVGDLAAGKGGRWVSDLEVANLGAAPVTVGVRLFPEGVAGAFDGTFPWSVSVAPGQVRNMPDVVAILGRPTPSLRGWLLVADTTPVDCASLDRPYPALLQVSSRTYRAGARRSGGGLQPNWLSLNATPFPSVLLGVPGNASAADTAVGVANVSTTEIRVRLSQIAPDGKLRALAERTVPALALGYWSFAELRFAVAGGGRVEVALADGPGLDPCVQARAERACTEPCDVAVCTQRYRFPAAPAFFALVTTVDRHSGVVAFAAPSIDYVGALRYFNEYRQRHCPELAGAASIVDLFAKLAFLRDPATLRPIAP